MVETKGSTAKNKLPKQPYSRREAEYDDCPVTIALDVIGGKWTIIILYHLRGRTMRFGQLKSEIPKITQKMLTHELRRLEANKLLTRKVYAEVPPRVEYTPTELANQLNPVLDQLCEWGFKYRKSNANMKID